jgi:hypothetical protein
MASLNKIWLTWNLLSIDLQALFPVVVWHSMVITAALSPCSILIEKQRNQIYNDCSCLACSKEYIYIYTHTHTQRVRVRVIRIVKWAPMVFPYQRQWRLKGTTWSLALPLPIHRTMLSHLVQLFLVKLYFSP